MRDNLFHIRAEQPARTLLVGTDHLLIERGLGKMTGTGLLDSCRRALQLCDIRTRDQHVVVHVNQKRPACRG